MPISKKPKIWVVLDHPMQLAIALAIVSYWSPQKFAVSLLISLHPYWKRVDINLYKQQFDEVYYLERPDYTWHPVRVIRWMLRIYRLKRRIARLNISPNDVIVGLSVFHYLENIVLSTHPDNLKIAIMPAVVYEECTREMDRDIYNTPPEGWIASRLVEPIMGLHRTYCRQERLHPEHYWWVRYQKPLLEIYDRVVVMGRGYQEKKLPEELVYYMPFPYVLPLGGESLKNKGKANKKKVVFFGDSFRAGRWGVAPQVYAEHLNQCLSFLRATYGSTHQLVYRPHPRESGEEIKYLDLDQFEIENDGMLSELYLYQNQENIDAVFSVGSTSSRTAFHFFINAYSFLDIFPFDDAARNHLKAEMGKVPDEFYIRDLSVTPSRYIKPEDIPEAIERCRKVLDTVLQER